MMRDTVMLGLRIAEGVSDAEFRMRFGRSLADYCTDRLPELVHAGVLRWDGDRLTLSPTSYFVSNAVLAEILPQADRHTGAATTPSPRWADGELSS